MTATDKPSDGPWGLMARLGPPSPPKAVAGAFVPTDQQCFDLWDRFDMLPHIREHSLVVAGVATSLAGLAKERGLTVNVQMIRASALLHDIAKTYTIRYGGNHSQLGGAWAQDLTGNPWLAMGIVHHVHWPWDIDVKTYFLPMAILYADKRVRHERVVSLGERFEDLYSRYGTTEYMRSRLTQSMDQARAIETALSQTLGTNLHEDSFDSGRLVE
jgi:putative nucleotidyltransferase with HDIG domain